MTGYQPGEQPGPDEQVVKLNTNENPYPPSPRVLEALRRAADEGLRLYPPALANAARARAAALYGFAPEQVLVGNGSDELLTLLVRAVVEPGQAIVYPVPTYSLYPVLAQIQGARAVEVPFPDDLSLPAGLCCIAQIEYPLYLFLFGRLAGWRANSGPGVCNLHRHSIPITVH